MFRTMGPMRQVRRQEMRYRDSRCLIEVHFHHSERVKGSAGIDSRRFAGQRLQWTGTINLADFVFGVLKKADEKWWTKSVSLNLRQKCAQRQEEESNRYAKECYADWIDLKTLMEKNWRLFEPHFRKAKCEGGKDKSLGWMDDFNQLRRLTAHPLKKHLSGYSFSEDDQKLLAKADDLGKRLLESFRTV